MPTQKKNPAFDKILNDAAEGIFDEVLIKQHLNNLKSYKDELGNILLHYTAKADSDHLTDTLLNAGANPHILNKEKETPFNYAATNSPKSGRLMTLSWFEKALEGKGSKRLDEGSGKYETPIAQYMAKWLNVNEFSDLLRKSFYHNKKINVFDHGSTSWTPLHGAAVMIGQEKVVELLTELYLEHRPELLLKRTSDKPFKTKYIHDGKPHDVEYKIGALAEELPLIRRDQDNLNSLQKDSLETNSKIIKEKRELAEKKIAERRESLIKKYNVNATGNSRRR